MSMYVDQGDGTWVLVWKVVFGTDGIARLWISSTEYVAIHGKEAERLHAELKKQDPLRGKRLVWTDVDQEESGDVPQEANRAVAGRIGYRRRG